MGGRATGRPWTIVEGGMPGIPVASPGGTGCDIGFCAAGTMILRCAFVGNKAIGGKGGNALLLTVGEFVEIVPSVCPKTTRAANMPSPLNSGTMYPRIFIDPPPSLAIFHILTSNNAIGHKAHQFTLFGMDLILGPWGVSSTR